MTFGVNGRLPRELITEHLQSALVQLRLTTGFLVKHKPDVRSLPGMNEILHLMPSPFTMWGSNVLKPDSHIPSKTATGLKHRRNNDMCKQMLLLQQLETIRLVGFSPILTPIT